MGRERELGKQNAARRERGRRRTGSGESRRDGSGEMGG